MIMKKKLFSIAGAGLFAVTFSYDVHGVCANNACGKEI